MQNNERTGTMSVSCSFFVGQLLQMTPFTLYTVNSTIVNKWKNSVNHCCARNCLPPKNIHSRKTSLLNYSKVLASQYWSLNHGCPFPAKLCHCSNSKHNVTSQHIYSSMSRVYTVSCWLFFSCSLKGIWAL